jgi:serine/threonine-protein kinase
MVRDGVLAVGLCSAAMDAPVRVGDVLAGKYRIERVLGAGGMGVVVAATHLQLDEPVAIKFLQPEALKDGGVVARFLREGRAAAKIRSEHVARVHDVGTLESGAPYLVMEYLDGSDLAAMVRERGPLPVELAVELVLQACEALADAHSIGIIHRDIKPANLFVTTRRDGSPAVKVIDFGISKVTTGQDAGMDITKTAEMRGSLLFMPPEQMTSPRDVDARSDIWALGVSLHYLLSGTYPFSAQSMPELCAMILQREPAPLRAARPDVPAGLEAVVLRCLRKDPAQRFSSVADLAGALAPFAPVHARVSADRIARVLHRSTSPYGRMALPSVPEAALTAGAPAMTSHAVGTEPLPGGPVLSSGGQAAAGKQAGVGSATGGQVRQSWGSTTKPEKGVSTRTLAALLASGILLFAVILGVWALSRKDASAIEERSGEAVVSAAASEASSVSSGAPSAVEVAPVVTPSAPPAALASALPTTSAIPSAEPAPQPEKTAQAKAGAPRSKAPGSSDPAPKPTSKAPASATSKPAAQSPGLALPY